jgi:hypothetical protein
MLGLCFYLMWNSYLNPLSYKTRTPVLETDGILKPVSEIRGFSPIFMARPSAKYMQLSGGIKEPSIIEPIPEPSLEENIIALNVLMLYVSLDEQRNIALNQNPFGNLDNTEALSAKLKDVFHQRTMERLYGPGMKFRHDVREEKRINKTVMIFAASSVTYEELMKLADVVRAAGANQVVLHVGDFSVLYPSEIERIVSGGIR